MSSGYTLPCVYCVNTSFSSSEQLKQHLLTSHSDLVSGSKTYPIGKCDDINVRKCGAYPPSSNVQMQNKDYSYPRAIFSHDNNIQSPNVMLQSSPVHSEADYVSDFSERKIKRMQEKMKAKDEIIENLTQELDELKLEMTAKEEDHDNLRQRWRKEAEDAIRYLKTNYEDMKTQNQLLERQLNKSEEEKVRVRSDNEKILKDHLDLQTQIAGQTRHLLQRNQSDEKLSSAEKDLEKEQETNKSLSTDVINLRKKNEALTEEVRMNKETIKRLQENITEAQNDLKKEKKNKDAIDKERLSLKGKLAVLEATFVRSTSDHEQKKSNISHLTTKVSTLESNKIELSRKIKFQTQTITTLTKEVNSLRNDKEKLVDNLHNADAMLRKLSQQLSNSKLAESNNTQGVSLNDTTRFDLDKILSAVKQVTLRDMPSNKEQTSQLSSELQRVNLLLIDEKATVKELRKNIEELEICIKSMEETHGDSEKILSQLQTLRSKHQKCVSNEKLHKQMKLEIKILNRKYTDVKKQHEFISVLYDSLKSEMHHKEEMLKERLKEKTELKNENRALLNQIDNRRDEIAERDKILEKYKRESCYLLEKLNTATAELQKLKSTNDMLAQKVTEFHSVKSGIESLQARVEKLNDCSMTSEANTITNIETLLRKNVQLTNQVIQGLQEKLGDGEHLYRVQQNIQEITKYAKPNVKKLDSKLITDYEMKIENLSLEKEILSSRVLILEGIREEMEQLKREKEKLRQENAKLKEISKNSDNFSKARKHLENISSNESNLDSVDDCKRIDNAVDSSDVDGSDVDGSDVDGSDENSLDNEFLESVKNLDQLNEEEKSRLKEMLSMPEFQRFLSSNEIINLHDDSETLNTKSIQNLSSENFEDEHLVNHIYQDDSEQASNSREFVQGIYDSELDKEIAEITMNYVEKNECKNATAVANNNHHTLLKRDKCFNDIVSESKSISKSIARQIQSSGVNYKEVLKELGKVFEQVSSDKTLGNRSKSKQVQFSEHRVEMLNRNNTNSTKKNPDVAAFHETTYGKTTENIYAQSKKNNSSEKMLCDDSTSLFNSCANPEQPSSSPISRNKIQANVQQQSPSPGLKERALKLIQSDPSTLTPNPEGFEDLTCALSPILKEDKDDDQNNESLTERFFSKFQRPSRKRYLSSSGRHQNETEGLLKGLGILPLIPESKVTAKKTDVFDQSVKNPINATNTLHLLKSFIDKADTMANPRDDLNSLLGSSKNLGYNISPSSNNGVCSTTTQKKRRSPNDKYGLLDVPLGIQDEVNSYDTQKLQVFSVNPNFSSTPTGSRAQYEEL